MLDIAIFLTRHAAFAEYCEDVTVLAEARKHFIRNTLCYIESARRREDLY